MRYVIRFRRKGQTQWTTYGMPLDVAVGLARDALQNHWVYSAVVVPEDRR